jgi:uncharacterized protein (TIGR03032 family)
MQSHVPVTHSTTLVDVLREAGCCLLVSTYQAGSLLGIGTYGKGLVVSSSMFMRPMGIAVRRDAIAVGDAQAVWRLSHHPEVAAQIRPEGQFDSCYLPRVAIITRDVACHEVAWGTDDGGEETLWFVNTLFSCLATVDPTLGFVPRWAPPFITALEPEDRCHLNGVAMAEGQPAFATVMAQTDTAYGWRAEKATAGCVVDVRSGEVVSDQLCMPHSPRLHGGRLFVLDSGAGALDEVDLQTGKRTEIVVLPGFTRGLAFTKNLAVVGLSRIRDTAVFGGVPLAKHRSSLKCGLALVDIQAGATLATLELPPPVLEVSDVQLLPGSRCVTFGGDPGGPDADVWTLPSHPGWR